MNEMVEAARSEGELFKKPSCWRVGKLLGQLAMPLIRGALIPYDDTDFRIDIQVYSKAGEVLKSPTNDEREHA